jgi:hypothetical protein
VFGGAACLSSTFSHKDDLNDRVLTEPKSTSKFCIDSGWPGGNYEVTLAMALAMQSRGYVSARFLRLTFPFDEHDESAWGKRVHLPPLQLFLGKVATASRGRDK